LTKDGFIDVPDGPRAVVLLRVVDVASEDPGFRIPHDVARSHRVRPKNHAATRYA